MAVVGIVKGFFGGNEIPLMPGSTLKRGGLIGVPVMVGNSVSRAMKMEASEANLNVALGNGVQLDVILPRSVDQEFQFETDTGQKYIIDRAFVSGSEEIGSDGNATRVTIAGGEAVEVTV